MDDTGFETNFISSFGTVLIRIIIPRSLRHLRPVLLTKVTNPL